ncbi:hypothetical protein GPECTOR_3g407 [Gonium pectorale]|uniref:Uncharacterized protein n=1 Tax=Gonium pectorale TaxID=33097 RepID=A0A150H129_GONPE|nr:hypothetical protein GPECTOR_3g407 [Gonium pectorale]|eukprot:KXZ55270.1 hypothetical protein GPECTOR_3g407 [Gonium pectorale]
MGNGAGGAGDGVGFLAATSAPASAASINHMSGPQAAFVPVIRPGSQPEDPEHGPHHDGCDSFYRVADPTANANANTATEADEDSPFTAMGKLLSQIGSPMDFGLGSQGSQSPLRLSPLLRLQRDDAAGLSGWFASPPSPQARPAARPAGADRSGRRRHASAAGGGSDGRRRLRCR